MGVNIQEKPTVKIVIENNASEQATQKEEVLKAKIDAGEWEVLPTVEAFQERSPEGQIIAMRESVDNRISQLRKMLPQLLNKEQRASYIQILDRIHQLESGKDRLLNNFFSRLGQRKISSESKGKNYY